MRVTNADILSAAPFLHRQAGTERHVWACSAAVRRHTRTLFAPALAALTLACGAAPPPTTSLRSDCAHAETAQCLGALRVLPYVRAAAEEGDPDAIATLGRWNDTESEPTLRELMRPGVGMPTRFAAAMALVDLGATDAPLAAFCTQLEDDTERWPTCLEGLTRLDASLAVRYARDWASRQGPLTRADDLRRASWAVEQMREHGDASDLPQLTSWAEQVEAHRAQPAAARFYALLQAARLRLGDPARASWLETPPETETELELFVTGLGAHVEDASVLARLAGRPAPVGTAVYDALDRLLPHLPPSPRQAETPDDAPAPDPRADLQAALRGLTEARAYEGSEHHDPVLLARHLGTLARLEDGEARAQLEALSETDGAGAPEALLQRVALGQTAVDLGRVLLDTPDRARLDRVVSALPSDGRWAVALLNPQLHAHAVHHLARHRDAHGVCEAVTERAAAHPESTSDALFALTLLGPRCRDAVAELAETAAPTRDAALLTLGMMRAPALEALAERYADRPASRVALDILHRPD